MAVQEFRLPDVGEGLVEAEIVSWKVKPGDTVKLNDTVVEIETAKSLVELPVPFAGVIAELLVPEGETVPVGTPIISVNTGDPAGAADLTPPVQTSGTPKEDLVPEVGTPGEEEWVEPGLIGGPAPGGRTAVLVGYGPKTTEAKRRPRKGAAQPETTPAPATPTPAAPVAQPTESPQPTAPPPAPAPSSPATPVSAAPSATVSSTEAKALAKPPVRKLAKDLGIDLADVTPTGEGGIITRADVESHGSTAAEPAVVEQQVAQPVAGQTETRIPIKGVRKVTAQAMVASAFTAPHVTEWVTTDVTATMELVQRLKKDRAFDGIKVSPLLVIAKACMLAMRRTPELNSAWDEANQEIVVKHGVNLGIAAATPRGLIVPNIKGADTLSLPELGRAINELTAVARDGRTQPADQAGGSFTITNVGVFGIDAGTPILNPGEVGILAVGAIRKQPWVVDDEIVVRQVTTLAVSFDHRVVDGEQGSRFLSDLAGILEDPGRALLF